ncbi:MAG: class I SAM-dependent methyltransferase [Candidatus Dormibacteraeota bacterium]|nr:class I SAM-dependent methyltransferase [Candidatus Dormibacteraeota bacterium]
MSADLSAPDWHRWLERWEAQQGSYMPDREARFTVIIDTVEALCGGAPTVIDLGSGPGSLARRILDRLPGARVTAIDMDPVLLAIGRNALGDYGGRLHWLDADLRSRWSPATDGRADAAVSTTALHWLQPNALAALYRHLGTVLAPGGVFVNGDRMEFPPDLPRLAGAARSIRERPDAADAAPGETWEEWWAAVEQVPGLAAEVAERNQRHHEHPDHEHHADLATHIEGLRQAGFSEVGTIWQHLADRVLVAIR